MRCGCARFFVSVVVGVFLSFSAELGIGEKVDVAAAKAAECAEKKSAVDGERRTEVGMARIYVECLVTTDCVFAGGLRTRHEKSEATAQRLHAIVSGRRAAWYGNDRNCATRSTSGWTTVFEKSSSRQ